MLNLVINALIIIAILIYSFKDYPKAVVIYSIATFVAPVFRIGSLDLSFDIVCFPIIFLFFLNYESSWKDYNLLNGKGYSFVPYFIIYLLATYLGVVLYDGVISFASMYAIVRFIFVLHILKSVFKGEIVFYLDKVLSWVLLVNVIFSFLQLAKLLPVEVFYNLYYKESLTPLATQMEIGYFNRAYGSTGSPIILGWVSAVSYTFYLSIYATAQYKIKNNILKLLGSAFCGILALSKTAILAIPIISVFIIGASLVFYGAKGMKTLKKIFVFATIGLIVITIIVLWMEQKGFAINYYLEFLKDPLKALDTRYDDDSGILVGAMETIKTHFLIGVGHANLNDAFVGDSVYVVLLYQTGIVGLIAYFIPYLIALGRAILNKDLIKSSLIVVFFLISVGSSLYVSCFLLPFVAVCFSNYKEKPKSKRLHFEFG